MSTTGDFCIHSDTVNGDTNIVDSSDNEVSITNYGVIHSTEQARFGKSSLYFNGNTNSSSSPVGFKVNKFYDLLSKDSFSIDFWIFPIEASVGHSVYYNIITDQDTTSTTEYDLSGYVIRLVKGVSGYKISLGIGLSMPYITSNEECITQNQWSHVFITKTSAGYIELNNISIAVNGIFKNLSRAVSYDQLDLQPNFNLSGNDFTIIGNGINGVDSFCGYIDEFRVVENRSLWTSSFTPPATIALTVDDVWVSGDYGYLCIQSPDGSIDGDITMKDSSPNNHTIANISDIPAKHSTDIALFGSSSIYFSGDYNSYLSSIFSTNYGYDYELPMPSWSFDAWIYLKDNAFNQMIFFDPTTGYYMQLGHTLTTDNNGYLVFTTEFTTKIGNGGNTGIQISIVSDTILQCNLWYHVYVGRHTSHGSASSLSLGTLTARLYLAINGIMKQSSFVCYSTSDYSSRFCLRSVNVGKTGEKYMEEIRVCDYVPYTTDFIVPNMPYGTVSADDNPQIEPVYHSITAEVMQGGIGVESTVRLYNRATGVLIEEKTSNAQGIVAFTDLTGIDESTECQIVVVDDGYLYNDIIRNITLPYDETVYIQFSKPYQRIDCETTIDLDNPDAITEDKTIRFDINRTNHDYISLSDDRLKATATATHTSSTTAFTTAKITNGKVYWEVEVYISNLPLGVNVKVGLDWNKSLSTSNTSWKYDSSYAISTTDSAIFNFALDKDDGKLYGGVNGYWFNELPYLTVPINNEFYLIKNAAYCTPGVTLIGKGNYAIIKSKASEFDYPIPEGFIPLGGDEYASEFDLPRPSSLTITIPPVPAGQKNRHCIVRIDLSQASNALEFVQGKDWRKMRVIQEHPQVVDDDFSIDYFALGNQNWDRLCSISYITTIMDNTLKLTTLPKRPALTILTAIQESAVRSTFRIRGDFDISVDYSNLELLSYPAEAFIAVSNDAFTDGCFNAIGQSKYTHYDNTASEISLVETIARTNDYGCLKIVRIGTTATTYYKDGTADDFTELGTCTIATDDMMVAFGLYSNSSNNNSIKCVFDNFQLK